MPLMDLKQLYLSALDDVNYFNEPMKPRDYRNFIAIPKFQMVPCISNAYCKIFMEDTRTRAKAMAKTVTRGNP